MLPNYWVWPLTWHFNDLWTLLRYQGKYAMHESRTLITLLLQITWLDLLTAALTVPLTSSGNFIHCCWWWRRTSGSLDVRWFLSCNPAATRATGEFATAARAWERAIKKPGCQRKKKHHYNMFYMKKYYKTSLAFNLGMFSRWNCTRICFWNKEIILNEKFCRERPDRNATCFDYCILIFLWIHKQCTTGCLCHENWTENFTNKFIRFT